MKRLNRLTRPAPTRMRAAANGGILLEIKLLGGLEARLSNGTLLSIDAQR